MQIIIILCPTVKYIIHTYHLATKKFIIPKSFRNHDRQKPVISVFAFKRMKFLVILGHLFVKVEFGPVWARPLRWKCQPYPKTSNHSVVSTQSQCQTATMKKRNKTKTYWGQWDISNNTAMYFLMRLVSNAYSSTV